MSDFELSFAYSLIAIVTSIASLKLYIFLLKPSKRELILFRDNLPKILRGIHFNDELKVIHKGKLTNYSIDYMIDEGQHFPFLILLLALFLFLNITYLYIQKLFIEPQDLNTSQPMKVFFFIISLSIHVRALFFGIRLKK